MLHVTSLIKCKDGESWKKRRAVNLQRGENIKERKERTRRGAGRSDKPKRPKAEWGEDFFTKKRRRGEQKKTGGYFFGFG